MPNGQGGVTPEMAEAGAQCWVYWDQYSDEPSGAVIATHIFNVICAVRDGLLTLDQVRAAVVPDAEPPFSEMFS